MLDEQTIINMFENEVICYYTEGKNIYAVVGTEVNIMPNTEHNITLCEEQIYSKITLFENRIEELNEWKSSLDIRENARYFLERIMNRDSIRYWYSVTYLYEHIAETSLLSRNIVEDSLEINGEFKHVEAPLAHSNMFGLELGEVNSVAKELKKEIAKSKRMERK